MPKFIVKSAAGSQEITAKNEAEALKQHAKNVARDSHGAEGIIRDLDTTPYNYKFTIWRKGFGGCKYYYPEITLKPASPRGGKREGSGRRNLGKVGVFVKLSPGAIRVIDGIASTLKGKNKGSRAQAIEKMAASRGKW